MDWIAVGISTHAPRTGSDMERVVVCALSSVISTHAPRTGSDELYAIIYIGREPFQPTLPARGATSIFDATTRCRQFQPTLPARGATGKTLSVKAWAIFQPTLPARGATATIDGHDLHVTHFNPRSPHGERHVRITT